MDRLSKALSHEAIRHALASVIAGIIAAVGLGVGQTTGAINAGAAFSSLYITLLFGLYGPAFLILTWVSFRSLEGDALRAQLIRTENRSVVTRWLLLSSPTSWAGTVLIIGVISVVLLTIGDSSRNLWIVLICLLGVAGSWVLMVAIMAAEYMRRWANEDSMVFPGSEARAFTDFLYLSVQLSTTFSSSDVELTQRGIRRLVTLHSVLAFAYSTAIIAVFASLLISVAV